MRFKLLFLLLMVYSGLMAHDEDSIRLEERSGKYYIIHQVDPGETIYSLGRRYNVDASFIGRVNSIEKSEIKVGQFLEIPFDIDSWSVQYHEVVPGETLYSIARLYSVDVEQIRDWNDLRSDRLTIGQKIIIGEEEQEEANETESLDDSVVDSTDTAEMNFFEYYVQTGESLDVIARRYKTSVDSIRIWNNLKTLQLEIGQKLIFPFEIDLDSLRTISTVNEYRPTDYGSKIRSFEEGGITKVFEEGLARKIETTMNTEKYLALHRKLKVGSILQVKNLMNNQTIYVRIVGKLPNTGLNENVMVRLTPIAFKRLGIIDDRSMVEINYFQN